MIVDVTVPVLAESVPDATLLEWNKQVGEAVIAGDILIELETDKVVLEVPAPEDGVLSEIVRQSGETVLSEEILAKIDRLDRLDRLERPDHARQDSQDPRLGAGGRQLRRWRRPRPRPPTPHLSLPRPRLPPHRRPRQRQTRIVFLKCLEMANKK